MPSDRHVERDRNTPRIASSAGTGQDAMHGVMRPRHAADVVVAFTLGRLVLRVVGCSSPVVAPLGHAQRKRKMCRKRFHCCISSPISSNLT